MRIADSISCFLRRHAAGGRLRAVALRGGTLLGGGGVLAQALRFARNIILTRVLVPEAFGVMAIVLSVSSMMDTFTEIGIKEAIIQNANGHEERYVNSAWWLSFGRSIAIYIVIFLAAPLTARFYGNADLTWLMRVALLSVLFSGAVSSRAFAALKALDFKKWVFIQSGSSIASTILTIVLALVLKSVWALAIGFAAEYLFQCITSFVLCPFLPTFDIDVHSVQDLLRFSKGIVGLSFLNLIFSRTDIFVLGRMIPADQLGVYTIATLLAQVPASFVLVVLGQVLMPMYSKINGENDRINRILASVTSVVVALFVPALGFVLLSGHSLLSVLYGARYESAFLPLVVAVPLAFVNIANGQITTVLYAAGAPQLHRRCVAIMAAVMIVLIYPFVRYLGVTGAQLAGLVAIVIGYSVQLRQIRRLTAFQLRGRTRQLALAVLLSGAVLGVALGTREVVEPFGIAPGLVYGAVSALLALGASVIVMIRGVPRGTSSGLVDAPVKATE